MLPTGNRVSPIAHWLVLLAGLSLGRSGWAVPPAVNQAPRVKAARVAKEAIVRERFAWVGVAYPAPQLLLRGFKLEDRLEVWAGPRQGPLVLVHRYRICARSGELGPKRRRGDLQVPEGVYQIDRFNAYSQFHLSLGVSYPNASDRILGHKPNLGGDIYIHGDCVTIGCLPLEDGPIEELFLIALDAHNAGLRQIPVHLFPTALDTAGLARLADLPEASRYTEFWRNLSEVYQGFERTHQVPRVRIDPKTGAYRVLAKEPARAR